MIHGISYAVAKEGLQIQINVITMMIILFVFRSMFFFVFYLPHSQLNHTPTNKYSGHVVGSIWDPDVQQNEFVGVLIESEKKEKKG